MKYYTKHILEFNTNEECSNDIIDYLLNEELEHQIQRVNGDESYYYINDREEKTVYFSFKNTEWDNREKDMREMSIKFPNLLFTLKGEGEKNGDLWIEYYKGGLMQRVVAEITFREFDVSQLS